MLARVGVLVVLGGVFVWAVLGCSGSQEAGTYNAVAVERALEKHGFDVNPVFDRSRGESPNGSVLGLLNLFGDLRDVTALVADTSSDGAIGRNVSAWVFDTRSQADSFQADLTWRLEKGNVVVLVDEEHKAAASAALDDLSSGG